MEYMQRWSLLVWYVNMLYYVLNLFEVKKYLKNFFGL